MRMRFTVDDEQDFLSRSDELCERFARRPGTEPPGAPSVAELAMTWKFTEGDGALDVWTVAGLRELLLDWFPNRVVVPPEHFAEIPRSVTAFVEFLADEGLLAPESDPPAEIRRFCESHLDAFVRAMATASEDDPDEEPSVIGPVRLPTEQDRLDSVRAARVPRQLRLLAEYCAPPGRQLTGTGNLRLADARHLVDALGTGDDPTAGGYGTLQSATELPGLDHLFQLAIEARVVRRHQGRLVAVARFTGLDEVAAHEKLVRAAVEAGLSGSGSPFFGHLGPVLEVVDEFALALLAALLDAGPDGVPAAALVAMITDLVQEEFDTLPELVAGMLSSCVTTQLERLDGLGVVTVVDDQVRLTPAGTPVAVTLVEEAGGQVLIRPDPTGCTAAELVDLIGGVGVADWTADATTWLDDRPAGVDELVGEACATGRDPVVLVSGLTMLDELDAAATVAAARRRLDGPQGGLVMFWLADRGEMDPSEVDPDRRATALIDLMASLLDTLGEEVVVESFQDADPAQQLEVLAEIWKIDHPRLPDILAVIGGEHPDKIVGKAARKALVRLRSRLASS